MTLVQSVKSPDSNDGDSTTVTVTAATTSSGNCCVGHVSWAGSSVNDLSTVSDGTNSYTIIDRIQLSGASGIYLATFIKANITGVTTPTITATFGAVRSYRRISFSEFSGIATTGQPNGNAINTSSSFGTGANAVTSGTDTTTATCTIWGVAYDVSSATIPSVGSSFTSADSASYGAGDAFRIEYGTGVASGSRAATFTTTAATDDIAAAMLAIEESGGTGGGSGWRAAFARQANQTIL